MYGLRASGRTLKFSGWLEAYGKGEIPKAARRRWRARARATPAATRKKEARDLLADDAEASLPELSEGQALHLVTPPGVVTEQKFTQGPPRYSEASLVRELEERGIGRPSTYAEIISKVQARDYVEKLDGARFRPTLLGKFVVDGLVKSELDFMDPAFTSKMEEELDEVEAGKEKRIDLLKRFYKRFRSQLDSSKKLKRWNPEPEPTDEKCEQDGGVMLKRWSKNGWFLGCANYPECKNTRDLGQDGKPRGAPRGGHRLRQVRQADGHPQRPLRRVPVAARGYPECKNARPVPLGVKCPKCGGDLIEIRPKKRGGQDLLRLLELPERSHQVRLQALAEAHHRAMPELRRAVPRPGRFAHPADDRVREQGVRIQARGRRPRGGRDRRPGAGGRAACGSALVGR